MARQRCGSSPRRPSHKPCLQLAVDERHHHAPSVGCQPTVRDSMPTEEKANRRGETVSLIRPSTPLSHTPRWYQIRDTSWPGSRNQVPMRSAPWRGWPQHCECPRAQTVCPPFAGCAGSRLPGQRPGTAPSPLPPHFRDAPPLGRSRPRPGPGPARTCLHRHCGPVLPFRISRERRSNRAHLRRLTVCPAARRPLDSTIIHLAIGRAFLTNAPNCEAPHPTRDSSRARLHSGRANAG
jgi:hypothetical protein